MPDPLFPTIPFDSLAVILPRYGAGLGGGAETLMRDLVLRFHGARLSGGEPSRLEVWTTCAKDHRTWENFYPAGATQEDGITVRRFPVDERDLEIFIGREMDIASGRLLHPDEQLDWLSAGVNSKALYQHIAREGQHFSALLFGPYLFPTTFWGGLIYPERSLLLPCLHNEPYAYQDVFGVLFRSVRGIICNAPAEAQLVQEIFGSEMEDKSAVVGLGFEPPASALNGSRAEKNTTTRTGKQYFLYSGRKEEGKNLHKLIEWFAPLRQRFSDVELVLIGSGEINFLKTLPPGVVDKGFVSEAEKREIMAGAVALCQPSINESFSIVLMESWLEKTPVLVHGDCPVTREHASSSKGGLSFSSAEEFVAAASTLLEQTGLRKEMGENGYAYVREEYSWNAVLNRLRLGLIKFGYTGLELPEAAVGNGEVKHGSAA